MRAQIDAILALARARSPDLVATTNMVALCESVIGDLSVAGLPTQRIVWESPPESVVVMADPVLAKMLVRNLMHNALQHAAPGEVTLNLTTAGLTLCDVGPGLPAAYRTLLAQSAERLPPPEGGLGLYLVTLIAERLGWWLNAEELPEGGMSIAVIWKKPELKDCHSTQVQSRKHFT